MDNFICGGYVFSSNFDSGNLQKVELVKWHEEALPNNESIAVELNLWTRPDCAGTEYENLNRSWFFFSIQGGDANKVCKLNIVNLNKQAKLFSQGMHPVIRIGDTGKWERMKDNPTYETRTGDFVLTFLHKPCMNTSTKYYYAFTFPFTYTECQAHLARLDSLYEKTEDEINYVVQRLNSSVDPTQTSDKNDTNETENEPNAVNELSQNMQTNIKLMENQSNTELENDIYYRRELIINSLEEHRVDLLTITSFHNIQPEHEYRFMDLFPESHVKRSNLFKNKKIIFVSSRVHPGETPASFILNGFLKMLLDRKNRYASILRKMYVFKIVPFLNPDGVYNGYYRSDTLGHNLNRVYLSPTKETEPTIYAVRKLLKYYHNTKNIDEIEPIPSDAPPIDNIQQIDITNNNSEEVTNFEMETLSSKTDVETSSQESSGEKSPRSSTVTVLTEININVKQNRNLVDTFSPTPSTSSTSPSLSTAHSPSPDDDSEPKPSGSTCPTSPSNGEESTNKPDKLADKGQTVFNDQFIVEIKPSMTTNAPPKLPTVEPMVLANQSDESGEQSEDCKEKCLWKPMDVDTSTVDTVKVKKISLKSPAQPNESVASNEASNSQCITVPNSNNAIPDDNAVDEKKEDIQLNFIKPNSSDVTSARLTKKALKPGTSGMLSNRIQSQRKTTKTSISNSINISSDFCQDGDPNANPDEESNMFLYIDLHGHASKKGIFMYGNHLPKINEAVECMLLPRLMSLNSHHFHFDACVFSERNMYHKGKRDGLSKEGSGRVAVYKTIGLIKCYTLEGNYNTGKYVNILPARGKEPNARRICAIPPKYTPVIYEEVGRALGPSILDLTDSNPISRLRNSEFRSLQGLRNALRTDIERSAARSESMPKATTSQTKSKCLKTSTACCSSLTDVCKENKRYTTNKPQISYGKKEKPTNVSSARKKVNPTTAPSIPTKRPKVIATKKFTTNDQTDGQDLNLEPDLFKGANFTKDETSTAGSVATCDESALPTPTSIDTNATPSTLDPDAPCCSYQMATAHPTAKLCGGFSGTACEPRTLRKAGLTKDGRRLKKKKTLKADTGLKRKKPKVF